jgi:hypothetical protein
MWKAGARSGGPRGMTSQHFAADVPDPTPTSLDQQPVGRHLEGVVREARPAAVVVGKATERGRAPEVHLQIA